MGTRLSLFAGGIDVAGALAACAEVVRQGYTGTLEANEGPDGTVEVRVHCGGATLRLSAMARVRPGDAFSRMVLGLANWCEVNRGTAKDKELARKAVFDASVAVGVVAVPELTGENDARADFIFDVAQQLSAIIFTGSDVLDASGRVLVTAGD